VAEKRGNPAWGNRIKTPLRAEQFFHNLFDEAQVLTEPWLVVFPGIADLGLGSVRAH
jgi:hypothetical protein